MCDQTENQPKSESREKTITQEVPERMPSSSRKEDGMAEFPVDPFDLIFPPDDTPAPRKGRAGACFDLADCEACTGVVFGAIGAMTAEQLAEGHDSLGAAGDKWQERLDYLEECCRSEHHHGGPEEAVRACRIAILKVRTAMDGDKANGGHDHGQLLQ